MEIVTTTEKLDEICRAAKEHPYVTVDTEFLRERTYFSKLCLVQLALPGSSLDDAFLIDPLSRDLCLDPLFQLFKNRKVIKVFHASRQDLEIFCLEAGIVPKPLFDTQVAAMVCGFGDQVAYETLVKNITKQPLDKSPRFTDWSRRPLTDAQKAYALADVTHLRQIYEFLSKNLNETGRAKWLQEELEILTNPETYIVRPEDAWLRVRTRTNSPYQLAIIRCLAEFREKYAQQHNIPRNRVFKDEALLELAFNKPRNLKELHVSRLLQRDARKGELALGIVDAIIKAEAIPKEDLPSPKEKTDSRKINPALADLLRVLLKAKVEQTGVAPKLIASSTELDSLAAGQYDIP